MVTKFHIPTPPLNAFVESIIYFNGYQPQHSIERVVPDGTMHLIMELDGLQRTIFDNRNGKAARSLSGFWFATLQTDFLTISAHKNSEMIVARFHAYGAYSFLGKNMNTTAGHILGPKALNYIDLDELRLVIIECDESEAKIACLENWLIEQINVDLIAPDVIRSSIELIKENAFLQLKELVDQSSYSKKQFIHLFKKHIGITPKLFQRIIRFNELLQKIERKQMISWIQVSLDCGYYDQAHFIKDFKAFSGLNPTDFLEIHKESDRINFFPFE